MRKYIPEFESSGLSVVGPVREDNQDSIHWANDKQTANGSLFAVADGMGGYAHGGMASSLALESFSQIIASQNGNSIPKTLQRGVENANLKVYQKAQQLGAGRMGTTLTAAYVVGNMAYLAHVGDSRVYLIRDGQATCLTADHTTVGDMVRAKILSPDKIRTHAQRSVLNKAIGIGLFVQPDITQHKLKEDDRLILCSDGVWSVIEDNDFARVAAKHTSANSISQKLVELALQHHTDDNASVVVFHLKKLVETSTEHESPQENSWFKGLRKFLS
ncbi:MAG: serine/threonine-protein phosphatase [Anaerolineales bacterium]|nr:serine/threonine-protein phosphatase [Anaerolineales bacterium]